MKKFCHARLVKATLLLFSFLLFAKISNAQCTLGKGDIVFTGYDLIDDQVDGLNPADGLNDRFSFVILRDVTVNTEIFFTDLGWTNQGKFQTRERAKTDGVIRWKADINYPAGTEITVNSKFNPSADKGLVSGVLENYETDVELPGLPSEYMSLAEISGDQIFAFTGNYLNNPTLLASISINTTWTNTLIESETSSGKSMLPAVLSSGAQNLSISRVDPNDSDMRDAYTARLIYLGNVIGSATSIIGSINQVSNWQLSNPATPFVEFGTLTNGNTFNLSLPVITSQPVDASNICFAGATFFEVIADATACSFQWQILNTNTNLWENLVNGGVYTNVSTSKLMISNVIGLNGKKFRVQVYGTGLTLSSEVSISFPLSLAITTLSIPDAAKNVNYNQQLNQTGGKAAYTYSMNTGSVLPAGMTLSGAGLLGGSPTVDGTYNFTIKVTDGCASEDLQTFTLNVTPEPLLTSISVPANGFYKSGENLDFTVNYDASVVVNNTPLLGITIGSSNVNASYLSGSGTSSLKFRYTVQAGDLDANGITITGITLNGGTIKSFGGSNAINTLQNVGSTASINIDGVIPVINSVTSSAPNALYNEGTSIPIIVTFSENVTVTGTPQLSLETGITDRTVNYASGSGTNSLVFNYIVQSGDITADLDYTSTSAMDLNGGTIRDNAGNSAIISLPAPGAAGSVAANKNLVIDAQLPTVLSLTSTTTNGTYKIADVINITMNMSEAVTVTGTPTLSLNSGGTASYASGSGTSTLSFTYTVATNDGAADLDYAAVNSLSLAGGTIKDAATNSAVLTLPATGSANSIGGQKNIIIDGIIPLIAGTAVPANGTYVEGNNLDFVINFSEAVTLNSAGGTPYISLTLNNGGSVSANYISGSGSSSLTFRYSVISGNQDSDGITLSNSITLNGGTISDAVGNNAVVSGINFSSTAFIRVDGIAPTATIVLADSDLKAGETSLLTITFSETITGFTSADLSVANATISSLITNDGGITWTATLTPIPNIEDASNIILLDNTGVMDLAGNAGRGTTQSSNYAINTKIPTLINTTLASNNVDPALAKTGDLITLSLTASETINTPIITIAGHPITPIGRGNSYTATYTLGENDLEGIITFSISFSNLAGNNGIPVSQTSNNSTITFDRTAPVSPVGLLAVKGDKQLELTWTANQEIDIKTYNIYGGTTANPNTLLQRVSSTSTSFSHTGLINGTTYYYRISAQDITGNESPLTADVSAIPAEAQTITFNQLPVKTYGDPDFNAGATASSGLNINYSSDNELVAKVNPNGIIQIIGAGSAKITASVPENIAFLDAPAQTQLLRVNKKDITLTLNALPEISKVYNGDNIATLASANYSLTGLKSGDQISVSGTITYDDKNVGMGKVITGSDFILLGAKKDNYNLITSRVNTIGDVTQKALSISAKDQQKIYGELLTFAGSEFISDGLVAGDAISSLSLSSSGAPANAIVGANYGILPASANGIGLNNYNISYISGTLLVAKKNLVISAENKTRFAGTENPTFTLTYEGFVNGEDQSIFSPLPEAINLATSGSTIGEYPITIKPIVALNYNIVYRPGILKIIPGAPKALSLASEVFFENSPIGSLVGTMSSESDDTNATFTYSLVSGTGDGDNSLFSISANKLLSLAELDFERKSTYSIRVSSATQYGFSLEKILSINLSDVNEAPSLAVISNQAICYSTALQQINLSGINAGPEGNRQTVAVSVSTNSTLFSELSVNNNGILRYRVNEGRTGIATIKVIVKDNGGTDNGGVDSFSREFTISVNPLPEILLSSDKGNSISKGETIRLTASGGSSYTWRNAFGIISGQQSATLTIRPAETATYFVNVTTAAGCVSEQQITVEVNHDYRLLKATNILTPNGDGVNDRFLISNIDLYPNNTVRIYDRFGRTLFTKANYLDEWDGTFQGSGLPEDTYFYIVDFGPGKIKMKGFISLVQGR
jgi:large repetitive protein